jgi:hypothetical protein
MKQSFREYMNKEHLINRWMVLIIAMVGAITGAFLMFFFALMGLLA